MKYRAAAKTDPGLVRPDNQDSYAIKWTLASRDRGPSAGFFTLADGVGGSQRGDIASAAFTKAMSSRLHETPDFSDYRWARDEELRKSLLALLATTFSQAAGDVYRQAQARPDLRAMATTGVAMVAVERGVFLAHAGDSRAYLLRGGTAFRLTEDHTIVNELIDEGVISPEEAARHPMRNALSRSIGGQARVEPDTLFVASEPGDRFLLCSDGLTRYLRGADLAVVSARHRSLESFVDELVQLACDGGGRDNITVLVVEAIPEGKEDTVSTTAVDLPTSLLLIGQTQLFSDLTDQELIRVMRVAHVVSYEAGALVLEEGSHGQRFFLVLEGTARVAKSGELLALVGPGDHFGEMALLDDHPRSADVLADTRLECLVISRDDLADLMDEDLVVAKKLLTAFLRRLTRRVRALSDNVCDLGETMEWEGVPAHDEHDEHDEHREHDD